MEGLGECDLKCLQATNGTLQEARPQRLRSLSANSISSSDLQLP